MGVIEMVKKLKAIDKECNKNEELKKRLEPWVTEMNHQKPRTREEATKITLAFIEKYEEIKNQIGESHGQTKCVRKIEQINEG